MPSRKDIPSHVPNPNLMRLLTTTPEELIWTPWHTVDEYTDQVDGRFTFASDGALVHSLDVYARQHPDNADVAAMAAHDVVLRDWAAGRVTALDSGGVSFLVVPGDSFSRDVLAVAVMRYVTQIAGEEGRRKVTVVLPPPTDREPTTTAAPTPAPEATYTAEEISRAANRACDDLLEALDDPDSCRDALNLLINATLTYLDPSITTVREVIEVNYSEGYDDVMAHANGQN